MLKSLYVHMLYIIKGCDSNFEVNNYKSLKVATNETSTLH